MQCHPDQRRTAPLRLRAETQAIRAEMGCRDPLELGVGRVAFLIPSQVNALWDVSPVQGRKRAVVLARTALTSLQQLHNQGHGRH